MPKFSITVEFGGGLTASQQTVFSQAANRWQQIIIGDFPETRIGGRRFTSLVIQASGVSIDRGGGPDGNILGRAQPTAFLPQSGLPAMGIMEFDTFDLDAMERQGTFLNTIIHEMGHVLGIGTLWADKGLVRNSGTANPTFGGKKSQAEFAKLAKSKTASLPLENIGDEGTAEGHWRENVFGDELMTGFLSSSPQPISRMTIASLADLGYRVTFRRADPFKLPTSLQLAIKGIGAHESRVRRCTLCYKDPALWPARKGAAAAGSK